MTLLYLKDKQLHLFPGKHLLLLYQVMAFDYFLKIYKRSVQQKVTPLSAVLYLFNIQINKLY